MKRLSVLLLLVPIAFATGCAATKSSDPLSPTIAGPIPGVSITPPVPVDPAGGMRVVAANQPVTLTAANAGTSGVRPLSYLYEVATDAGFTNKVFTRDNIAPDSSGKTSLKLPDPLQAGHTYYWRAQAHDGANTSDYSSAANFDVYTPSTLDAPTLVSPIAVAKVSTLHPTFVIGDSNRSGTIGAVAYTIEVSDTVTFANKLAIWTVGESLPQTSLVAPQDLSYAKIYFWHARGYDPSTVSDWSGPQAFQTPDAPPPPPPPTTGGGTGGTGTLTDAQIINMVMTQSVGINPESSSALQTIINRIRATGVAASVLISNGIPSDHKTWIAGAEWSLISSDGFRSGTYRWDPYLQVEAPKGVAYDSCGIPVNSSFASTCK